ncbi:MAG TPA: DUF969 domain-containing protein [Caulobacter sp.]|nr:DUF969 domain-containing protein [Caulobacter sp.]
MLVLVGIAVVMAGFALRANPLPVIMVGALATGAAAAIVGGVDPAHLWPALVDTLGRFGRAFNDNRYFHVTWLILPLIGLLEREGLQARAKEMIARTGAASASRVLLIYLVARQATSALGLTSLGGQPQMVRPLIAPMAESAAENRLGPLTDAAQNRVRAMAAATDNIGLFFGEDIFIAIGSIVLIVGFLDQAGLQIEALHVSLWALPTAITAFLIHGARLMLFDRVLLRDQARGAASETAQGDAGPEARS